MTDMIGSATAAASNAWHECETCPGEMYVKEARVVATAAVVAFLDAVSPDILNRAGVPWTLEVVQAIDALKSIAQGE